MSRLFLMFEIRYLPLVMSIVLSAAFAVALAVHPNFIWLWIGFGIAIGLLFGTPGTGAISGFWFALLATLAWPWLMPDSITNWMDDLRA